MTITKPLSMIGDQRETTIVDASGLNNGFNVDGFDHRLTTSTTSAGHHN